MQSLSTNRETWKDPNPFLRNDIFKTNKILFGPRESSGQNIRTLERPKESIGKDEEDEEDAEIAKVETLSEQAVQISREGFGNGLEKGDEHPKGCKDEGRTTNRCFYRVKKAGDIVSTSRSGHLIERKEDGSSAMVSNRPQTNETEGCDKNDNVVVVEKEKPGNDVNDNTTDDYGIHKGGEEHNGEDASISDNGRSDISDGEAPCGIGILERLIRSHPVWFLPGIQRAGAMHLLRGKEEGNFIVRQSSQPDTMAVSVRLPMGKGPYIEHYLIQAVDGHLSLESSENVFESIPSLIAHYCQCCDELPVQLTLPRTIREAKNRQQLSSLALLGQEFWRYPMANPRPPESRNSSPNSTKSDSLSSFDGAKRVVKNNHDIILDLVPLHHSDSPLSSLLSTFKSSPIEENPPSLVKEDKPKRPHTLDLINTSTEKTGLLVGNKTPPQPPPRWTKPTSSATGKMFSSFSTTTTVTTIISSTAKFNQPKLADEKITDFNDYSSFLSSTYPSPTIPCHYNRNVSSPQSDQTNLKSIGFERDKNSLKLFQESTKRPPQLISPVSDKTGLTTRHEEKNQQKSQSLASTPTENVERLFKRYKKEGKPKESAHYQECDILESSSLHYYKSNVADKQSDYEDIWATESFTTFKPLSPTTETDPRREERKEVKKPPDLLEKLENSFKASFPDRKEERKLDLPIAARREDNPEVEMDVKQNSPFYAEPADALVVRRKARLTFNKSRHSDPFSSNNWCGNPYLSGGNALDRIDSQNEMNEELSWRSKPCLSFDNIVNLKRKDGDGRSKVSLKAKNLVKGKPVRPPKVDGGPGERVHQNWAVDSSWEFIAKEESEKEGERRFPSIEQQIDSEEGEQKCTVHDIIIQRFPQFTISTGPGGSNNKTVLSRENSVLYHTTQYLKSSESVKSGSRISAYDNLTSNYSRGGGIEMDKVNDMNCDNPSGVYGAYREDPSRSQAPTDTLKSRKRGDCGSVTEDNEDAQTIFSEPWDSSRWENLLHGSRVDSSFYETGKGGCKDAVESLNISDKMSEAKSLKEGLELQLSLPLLGLKSKELTATGASIRSYALHLASDKSTTFAQNIDNFIECTLDSKETSPQIVMRNMRQFMSGMKNYLVKHGEREFEKQVEKERMKLKSTEFLNLDSILEGVMHKLVVRPLREHLYKLFVDEYIKNGAIQLLYDNLIFARTKPLYELGLKTVISPPSQEALEVICYFVTKLQEVDSPLEKLDHLLACVSTLMHSCKSSNEEKMAIALGADDLLPLFVWVLVQSGFIAAEIEAEYMWGLLHPSLLSGEGCYYLTTLSSAVHVLKNLKSCDLDQSNRSAHNEWHCEDLKSVLKIIVPDELHGSILTKTLPVKPNMTTKDVCKIIAHKIRITNPQDYGLFRLVDGEETLLNDAECPQDVKSKLLESGKHCTLAYKRIDAKIGWPRTT